MTAPKPLTKPAPEPARAVRLERSLVGGNLLFVLDAAQAEKARAFTESALSHLVKFFRSNGMEVESVLMDAWTCEDPCR